MERKGSRKVGLTTESAKAESVRSFSTDSDRYESSSYSSDTQYYVQNKITDEVKKVNRKDWIRIRENLSESTSTSSETFNCEHGPGERQYSKEKILKSYLKKKIDPIKTDRTWIEGCPLTTGWEVAKTLNFMIKDPIANKQVNRLKTHLQDFARIATFGYNIYVLDDLCNVLEFLVEKMSAKYELREEFIILLCRMKKPILLNGTSDIVTYFGSLQNYINFMGYLLMSLEDDANFDLVSQALLWHLSAPNSERGSGTVKLSHILAAATGLCVTAVRMLSLANLYRFPTFLETALLLACDNVNNCMNMMKGNVLECIFYRFNPYFPEKDLPVSDINPADPEDINVKLGASSMNISTTLSLLLVLLKTTKEILDNEPEVRFKLPCPDSYSQRCFAWAYRYECRARDHRHERLMFTIIANCLLHCFGDQLTTLCEVLMADILSLSVHTEVPPREDWTGPVSFNTRPIDVNFKQALLYLSVNLLRKFPHNRFMMESQHWLVGVTYLLDPILCKLRPHWSPPLYADLRKTAFKALVCTLSLASPHIVQNYCLIRRLMWYTEWYSVSPYELPVLYWCLRVLQGVVGHRQSPTRHIMLKDLFDSHGIIIIIRLCHTLLDQKSPPIEKSQLIISLCLRLVTSALESNAHVSCYVYPEINWPSSVYTLANRMLNVVLNSLHVHLIINNRWLISLLNFIWEAIIWNDKLRAKFVASNGVFKLLDIITLSRPPVQCVALALVCDVARAGEAVGQLVTWRACPAASEISPKLVKRGATIANLLAAIFRDECYATKVNLNDYGVIQNLDCPLASPELREDMRTDTSRNYSTKRTPTCLPAADLAGSRLSKVHAILHMLSKDLAFKVSLADEAYNLYKNIQLPPQDETILILASHYLTLKLNETWIETLYQCLNLIPQDNVMLQEFLQIVHGWSEEVKRMQEDVIKRSEKENCDVECSFYEFLSQVRLNVALDALREVRCKARSSDRFQITHSMLHDAKSSETRRSELSQKLQSPILKTYTTPLDWQNVTGQHIKVQSIDPKEKEG